MTENGEAEKEDSFDDDDSTISSRIGKLRHILKLTNPFRGK
mgnify:CR=1 FL=1